MDHTQLYKLPRINEFTKDEIEDIESTKVKERKRKMKVEDYNE